MDIEEIFYACLFKEGDDTNSCIKASGFMTIEIFSQNRLQEHKTAIEEILNDLPKDLKIPIRYKWSTLHQKIERLYQLSISIGVFNIITLNEKEYHINNQ